MSPQVLEFRARGEVLKQLDRLLDGSTDATEDTGDALLAYTSDADAVLEKIRDSGMEIDNTVVRQAGLEDVFLRLTGRSLIE